MKNDLNKFVPLSMYEKREKGKDMKRMYQISQILVPNSYLYYCLTQIHHASLWSWKIMQLWHSRGLFEPFLLKGRSGGFVSEACLHLRRPRSHKNIRFPLPLCSAAIRRYKLNFRLRGGESGGGTYCPPRSMMPRPLGRSEKGHWAGKKTNILRLI